MRCDAARRVLLLRSGRHLHTAIAALQQRWPGCEIAVVGTPGSEPAIAQAGITFDNTFIYARRSRFSPLEFLVSHAASAARRWRFDDVAVLWNDPNGTGQGNVDRTAFLLAPRGFLAITPDGGVTERRLTRQIAHESRRTITSIAMALMLGVLYLPAWLLPSRRS
jgi:hypothetical protein